MVLLFAILIAFILYPVVRVLWIALSDETGNLTLIHFLNFFRRPLFREALWNTLVSAFFVVVFSALSVPPLAYISRATNSRETLLQTGATLPWSSALCRRGSPSIGSGPKRYGQPIIHLCWFGTTIPFMEGLAGVVLVQTLHFFSLYLAQYGGLAL